MNSQVMALRFVIDNENSPLLIVGEENGDVSIISVHDLTLNIFQKIYSVNYDDKRCEGNYSYSLNMLDYIDVGGVNQKFYTFKTDGSIYFYAIDGYVNPRMEKMGN